MSVANLVSLKNIIIVHGRNPDVIWNVIEDENSSGFFEQLIIDQGIDQIIPSGTLIVRDTGDILSHFNFSGRDPLTIEVGDIDPQSGQEILRTYNFIIYQATHATDYADRNSTKLITLKFIDELYFYNSRQDSSARLGDIGQSLQSSIRLISDHVNNILVGLEDQYEFQIDPTHNYYFHKESPTIFPSGRTTSKSDFLTELNYLVSNAVNVPKIVPDFFCWFNIEKEFNFISYSTMVDDSTEAAVLNTGNIDAIDEKISGFKINSITPICNISMMELENNGAFCSWYMREDPDLENPYFSLADSISGITRFPVTYQLGMPLRGGGQLFNLTSANLGKTGPQSFPPGFDPENITTDIFPPDYIEEMTDEGDPDSDPPIPPTFVRFKSLVRVKQYTDEGKWGYFDTSLHNSPSDEPSYTFYGKLGYPFDSELDFAERSSKIKWQNMFDIEEMNPVVKIRYEMFDASGAPAGICFEDVNFVDKMCEINYYMGQVTHDQNTFPVSINGLSTPWINGMKINPSDLLSESTEDERYSRSSYYFKLRKLQEKWNIFKYVVCCMNNSNDSFYALIVGATGVEESSDVIIDPIPEKAKAFKYAWKEIEFIPKAYDGLSGATQTVKLYPQFGGSGSAGCTFGIPDGISGIAGITGITFAYSHPFFEILIPNNARSGGFTGQTFGFTGFYPAPIGTTFVKIPVSPYFSAFNINELTNFELNQTGLKRKYAGPGINMQTDAFPLGNKIIPVGYMPSEDDPCIHQFNGQIVKMYQIPTKDISGLSLSSNDLKAMPLIYVFDVQNSVEGQCAECD